jgi:hypothetical protein
VETEVVQVEDLLLVAEEVELVEMEHLLYLLALHPEE